MWTETPLTRSLGLRLPLIQAPMAGAVGSRLTVAVSEAGGLGSISAAMLSPARITEEVAFVRAHTSRPFALNLFTFEPGKASAEKIARLHRRLASLRAELGLSTPSGPLGGPPNLEAQFRAALEARPPVLSFTFGIPRRALLDAFRALGTFLIGTATHLAEALALEAAGVDAICAQGSEAGGHRGTFIGRSEDALIGTAALVALLVDRVKRPVIAAGGLMNGRGIAAALALGAQAAQLGTAFLACPEAELKPLHLAALTSPAVVRTRVTRAYSGRLARGIVNRLMEHLDAHPEEILPYPLQSAAIRDLRAAAAAQGRADLQQLWAGQGAPLIRAIPAAELIRTLVDETSAALRPLI